jgi:peptidyl-tRNA hydrolase
MWFVDLLSPAGIGSPPAKMDMKAYVLQKFRVEEKEMVLLLMFS